MNCADTTHAENSNCVTGFGNKWLRPHAEYLQSEVTRIKMDRREAPANTVDTKSRVFRIKKHELIGVLLVTLGESNEMQ